MHVRLGVPRDQAEAIWRPLFQKHNQSLRVRPLLSIFTCTLSAYVVMAQGYGACFTLSMAPTAEQRLMLDV